MTEQNLSTHFVNWFRASSPYIHAHRNQTFVIFFSAENIIEECHKLIHDFALLRSLGIRLVLVHGIRPQLDQRMQQYNINAQFHHNLRITDDKVLQCVKDAVGQVRIEIESLLSMGLSNSPMAGAKIKVASGNFVIAKPLGVIEGIDFQHTGTVRRIEQGAIHQQLDQNNVVLISPLGYSPSGEIFNLSGEQVATEVAIALQAKKLILLTEHSCMINQQLVQQMTIKEAQQFLKRDQEQTPTHSIEAAIQSCQQGVERVHLINRHTDGALLLELFTRDGTGTLISADPFEEIRSATLNDIAGILELIKPLEQQGILVKRSREKLEMEISDYIIIERDGLIIGCTALHVMPDQTTAEIACVAIHPDYRQSARGNQLLDYLIKKAQGRQLNKLFVLSTQTMHWFLERGFQPTNLNSLPEQRQAFYNYKRNAKILCKEI